MNIHHPPAQPIEEEELVQQIRPRGPVYCPFHFLAVATKYYNANVEASRASLADIERHRTEELGKLRCRRKQTKQPIRVQPTRKAKANPVAVVVESKEAKLTKIAEKRYAKLEADLAIPKSNDNDNAEDVMGLDEWKEELVRLISKEETRKRSGRDSTGLHSCYFGSLPWLCRLCEQGKYLSTTTTATAPGLTGMSATVRGRQQRRSPVPVMDEMLVEGICDEEHWRSVSIPKQNVVRLGQLRFTVDVCGGTMLMFM